MENKKLLTLIMDFDKISTSEFNILIGAISLLERIGAFNIQLYQKPTSIIIFGRLKDLSPLALNTYKKWNEIDKFKSIGIIK